MKHKALIQAVNAAGLIIIPVTYRSQGVKLRRKGYDIADPVTLDIYAMIQPIDRLHDPAKWMIRQAYTPIKYVTRLTAAAVDLTTRNPTGHRTTAKAHALK